MTRPGGPAEPPGPSAGERIVQEWLEDRDIPIEQRIDTALVEVARERDEARRLLAVTDHNSLAHTARVEGERDSLRAALAEREAMVARLRTAYENSQAANLQKEAMVIALREALAESCAACVEHRSPCFDHRALLTSTADAAARCLTRARQEGAEEMREEIARLVDAKQAAWDRMSERHPAETCSKIAAAIRALDAGSPAARRG